MGFYKFNPESKRHRAKLDEDDSLIAAAEATGDRWLSELAARGPSGPLFVG
jgi:hypothetical protein